MSQPTDVVAEIEVLHAASAEDLMLLIQLLGSTECWEVGRDRGPGESDSDLYLERTTEVAGG